MLHRDDAIRLRHMLDAGRDAMSFIANRTRRDLDTNRQLSFALVRAIEIIGEAANKVSPEGQMLAPGVPWPEITAMRNRIVHAYYDVNLDLVWATVRDDLPPLIARLEQVLATYGGDLGSSA